MATVHPRCSGAQAPRRHNGICERFLPRSFPPAPPPQPPIPHKATLASLSRPRGGPQRSGPALTRQGASMLGSRLRFSPISSSSAPLVSRLARLWPRRSLRIRGSVSLGPCFLDQLSKKQVGNTSRDISRCRRGTKDEVLLCKYDRRIINLRERHRCLD